MEYQTPPLIDFLRAAVFISMGFLTNKAVVNSLGGDLFWGWSTGACLALPAALLSYSRIKRPSRESVDQENLIKKNFEIFAEKKLKRSSGKVAAEASIVVSFRRSFLEYRSKDDISDKELCKIVREWVGYKTNMEGDYIGACTLVLVKYISSYIYILIHIYPHTYIYSYMHVLMRIQV